MKANLLKFWPWVFALFLIPYAYCVWSKTPSHSHHKPDCTEYASYLSRNDVIIPTTGDAPEQQQTKTDEKVKLQASVECSDLHAQWAMADITFWAFSAGIPAILLVFFTWIATREGGENQRRNARNQSRAYIEVEEVTFEGYLKAKITNTGATPALWYEISSASKNIEIIKDEDMDWGNVVDFSEASKFTRWPALAKELTTRIYPKDGEAHMLKAKRNASTAMVVYGTVRYETIFNEIFETQYAVVAHRRFDVGDRLPRAPMNIDTFKLVSSKGHMRKK